MGKVAPMWLDLYIISSVSHSPPDFFVGMSHDETRMVCLQVEGAVLNFAVNFMDLGPYFPGCSFRTRPSLSYRKTVNEKTDTKR